MSKIGFLYLEVEWIRPKTGATGPPKNVKNVNSMEFLLQCANPYDTPLLPRSYYY